jgi:polar amino acid transport system permease protein
MLPSTRRPRFGWIDALVIAGLLALAAFVAYRVTDVLNYRWNWSAIPRFVLRWDEEDGRWVANLLLLGFFTTIRIAVWGSLVAGIVGLAIGLARVSRPLFLRLLGATYVEFVRNIPPLVFIFIFYFFVAGQVMPLFGLDEALKEASPTTLAVVSVLFGEPAQFGSFIPAVLAIGMFEAAFVAEILRAGIRSVAKGQWEASATLGLGRWSTLRFIVLPQAVRRVLPPLAGQFIALVKNSSLAALISVPDLTFAGIQVSTSTRGMFETWLTVGAAYFVLCFALSLLFGRLERRAAAGSRQ